MRASYSLREPAASGKAVVREKPYSSFVDCGHLSPLALPPAPVFAERPGGSWTRPLHPSRRLRTSDTREGGGGLGDGGGGLGDGGGATVGATVGVAAAGLGRVVAATETLLVFYWDSDNTDFRCSFRSHTPIEQVAPVVATAPRAQPERQTPAMQHPLGLGWSLARLRKEMARNAVVA